MCGVNCEHSHLKSKMKKKKRSKEIYQIKRKTQRMFVWLVGFGSMCHVGPGTVCV